MMIGKAKAPALPMIGTFPYRRLWDVLMRFSPLSRPATAHKTAAAVAIELTRWAERNPPFSRPAQTVQRPPLGRPVGRSELTPIHYLAIGLAPDRKAFTIAIRAFALARKLGDRLTVIGYGPHRRRLEKWALMLGIDAIVIFAQPDCSPGPDVAAYDTVILLSQHDYRQSSVLRDGLSNGLTVISMSLDANVIELLSNRRLGASVGSGDVLALSKAMLTAKQPDYDLASGRIDAPSGSATS